jgi:hypothetical protein
MMIAIGGSWASRAGFTTFGLYKVDAESSNSLTQFRCCVEPKRSSQDDYNHKKLKGQGRNEIRVAGYSPETPRFWFGFRCYRAT